MKLGSKLGPILFFLNAVFGGVNAPGGAESESDPRPHGKPEIAYASVAEVRGQESTGIALP